MPSLELLKRINNGYTNGNIHKSESDFVMEETWYNDIGAKVAYFYDYYHDDEPLKYYDLHPEKSLTKVPIDIKFIVNAYNSENKDVVGYHILFKPSFNWKNEKRLDYYQKQYIDKYESEFPIGCYLDIPDEKGIYRKWMVTEAANNLGLQFPTWYILPIDHVFQWVFENKKYQMCGVGRSQNSYNSGEWSDYVFTTVENQRKCILPMNDISTTIFYNQRIVLSAPIKAPITWHCSKVEQTAPKGINRITFAQEQWSEQLDAFEYEDGEISHFYNPNKKVTGMWASYYTNSIPPTEDDGEVIPKSDITSEIIYSGIKPEIKINGGYKKLTVNYYEDGESIETPSGTWSYTIDGTDVTDKLTILTPNDTSSLETNQIKIKFNGDDGYIGKILLISYTTIEATASLEFELISL